MYAIRSYYVNLAGMMTVLKEKGYAADSDEATLKDLAERYGVSPMIMFESIMADDRVYR